MLREVRVPMPAAAAATATATARPPRLKVATAALLRLAADAVLYGFLAALSANSLGGTFLEILGRRAFGKGSSVQAAGNAVHAGCKFVIVRLLPAFLALAQMRLKERVEFEAKEEEKAKEKREEEEREKPASNHIPTAASTNEQLPKRNRAHPLLPKGVKLAPFYAFVPTLQLMSLAIRIQLDHEEGSLMWSVGSVLFDVAHLGFAVLVGFFCVRNMVILLTVPRVKVEDNEMQ
ncbi:hypothetical protein ACP70R_047568 [Stipagrostis hirtigluma subsp. patula]